MIVNFLPLVLAITATSATSLPPEDESGVLYISSPLGVPVLRQKRSAFPGRGMMFHGYFGGGGHHPYPNPVTSHHGYDDSNNYRSYDPQGSMTAFAAGNTVSAGSSYYGAGGNRDCRNCDRAKKPANGNGTKKNGNGPSTGNGRPTNGKGVHQHEVPSDIPVTDKKPTNANGQEQPPIWNQDVGYQNGNGNWDNLGGQSASEDVPKGDALPSALPTIPVDPEGAKKGPAPEDAEEEEEEEEDEPSFFGRGKGSKKGLGPFYNSYFPMVFGFYPGFGGGRQGNREDGNAYNPGTATAIANSFSTGRGAVATSHATAYGGPHFVPSGYRRNGSRARHQ